MEQTPPVFSAKKVAGVPSHKLARAGKAVPLKPAKITIHEFVIESCSGELAEFSIRVSAGGYVRSVAHDLGQLLGCGAHLASLRRTSAGPFALADAVTLEELAESAEARDLGVATASSAFVASGVAFGDGGCSDSGKATQRDGGQSSRADFGAASEGIREPAGFDCDCEADCGHVVSADGGDRVTAFMTMGLNCL